VPAPLFLWQESFFAALSTGDMASWGQLEPQMGPAEAFEAPVTAITEQAEKHPKTSRSFSAFRKGKSFSGRRQISFKEVTYCHETRQEVTRQQTELPAVRTNQPFSPCSKTARASKDP
jgi:hypothetical protein